ncbi:MAG TPA: hypothetical protein VMV26_04550, partial [Alphaproteobacteria bacterium]|nr:hypothetical protein [Alphaproteobacteria bacterium]
MASAFTRFIATVVICVAIVAAVGYRLATLYGEQGEPPTRAGAAEDTELFTALLRTGLLTPRPDGGLDMAPPDYFLRRAAAGAKPAGSRAE